VPLFSIKTSHLPLKDPTQQSRFCQELETIMLFHDIFVNPWFKSSYCPRFATRLKPPSPISQNEPPCYGLRESYSSSNFLVKSKAHNASKSTHSHRTPCPYLNFVRHQGTKLHDTLRHINQLLQPKVYNNMTQQLCIAKPNIDTFSTMCIQTVHIKPSTQRCDTQNFV
jgi:hypothetical protein